MGWPGRCGAVAYLKIQAYLTAAVVNLKRLAATIALLIGHPIAHSKAVSIVHGHLMRSAFATAPVICLTLC